MMASQSESPALTVLSWNVNGLKAKLNDQERKEKLLKIIEQYDVVLLQETRIGEKDANKIKEIKSNATEEDDNGEQSGETKMKQIINDVEKEYHIKYLNPQNPENEVSDIKYLNPQNPENVEQSRKNKTMYVTLFSSRRRGVAILINKPHTCLNVSYKDGDYVWVHAEIGNQKYTFMNVYYHSKEPGVLMDNMSKLLKEEKAFQNKLVIGGDFNTTLDPNMDAKKENKQHKSRREELKDLMNKMNLSDVWREEEKNSEVTEGYTYSSRDPKSRLDYIFMLKKDLDCVQSCEIDNSINLSDHFPMILTLKKHPNVEEDKGVKEVTSDIKKMTIKKNEQE